MTLLLPLLRLLVLLAAQHVLLLLACLIERLPPVREGRLDPAEPLGVRAQDLLHPLQPLNNLRDSLHFSLERESFFFLGTTKNPFKCDSTPLKKYFFSYEIF